jgi:hypothetical protein
MSRLGTSQLPQQADVGASKVGNFLCQLRVLFSQIDIRFLQLSFLSAQHMRRLVCHCHFVSKTFHLSRARMLVRSALRRTTSSRSRVGPSSHCSGACAQLIDLLLERLHSLVRSRSNVQELALEELHSIGHPLSLLTRAGASSAVLGCDTMQSCL